MTSIASKEVASLSPKEARTISLACNRMAFMVREGLAKATGLELKYSKKRGKLIKLDILFDLVYSEEDVKKLKDVVFKYILQEKEHEDEETKEYMFQELMDAIDEATDEESTWKSFEKDNKFYGNIVWKNSKEMEEIIETPYTKIGWGMDGYILDVMNAYMRLESAGFIRRDE